MSLVTSPSSHLQGGKVDISLIQTTARNVLFNILEKFSGTKAIVWDYSLSGPVGLIAQYLTLKEYGVIKMYPLRNIPLPETNANHIIFFTRPKLQLMELIANNILTNKVKKQYHLVFVSKQSLLCVEHLKHKRVYGSLLTVNEFNCELFPFDSDLISMEIPEVFKEYTLENDPTYIYQTAQAIMKLMQLYGTIPKVWGKGVAAKHVWDLVERLQNNSELNNNLPKTSTINQIILIDRAVDLITPLATQLTYEGLIDEIFGIVNNAADFPIDNFLSSEERATGSLKERNKLLILDSADKLFAKLRDKNFNAVGPYLLKEANSISKQMKNTSEKSVQEMKLYVQRLPQLLMKKTVLAHHTAIAECIKNVTDGYEFLDTLQTEQEFLNCIQVDKPSTYIKDLISTKHPLIKVLRLICLQCLTSSGLKQKILENYKRELVHVYGLEALIAFSKLEKVGLIKGQSNNRQYAVLRKALRLTMEDTSEINPTDISYVHSVYAPLSIRIIEHIIKNKSWKQLQDVLGLLPGPTFEDSLMTTTNNIINSNITSNNSQVILVYFIGGCTFAEISALRFLSQEEESNVEFVIATTKLINGKTFLKSIIDS